MLTNSVTAKWRSIFRSLGNLYGKKFALQYNDSYFQLWKDLDWKMKPIYKDQSGSNASYFFPDNITEKNIKLAENLCGVAHYTAVFFNQSPLSTAFFHW